VVLFSHLYRINITCLYNNDERYVIIYHYYYIIIAAMFTRPDFMAYNVIMASECPSAKYSDFVTQTISDIRMDISLYLIEGT